MNAKIAIQVTKFLSAKLKKAPNPDNFGQNNLLVSLKDCYQYLQFHQVKVLLKRMITIYETLKGKLKEC